MTEQLREKSILILSLKSCTSELCKKYKFQCGNCCFYRILALFKEAGYVMAQPPSVGATSNPTPNLSLEGKSLKATELKEPNRDNWCC